MTKKTAKAKNEAQSKTVTASKAHTEETFQTTLDLVLQCLRCLESMHIVWNEYDTAITATLPRRRVVRVGHAPPMISVAETAHRDHAASNFSIALQELKSIVQQAKEAVYSIDKWLTLAHAQRLCNSPINRSERSGIDNEDGFDNYHTLIVNYSISAIEVQPDIAVEETLIDTLRRIAINIPESIYSMQVLLKRESYLARKEWGQSEPIDQLNKTLSRRREASPSLADLDERLDDPSGCRNEDARISFGQSQAFDREPLTRHVGSPTLKKQNAPKARSKSKTLVDWTDLHEMHDKMMADDPKCKLKCIVFAYRKRFSRRLNWPAAEVKLGETGRQIGKPITVVQMIRVLKNYRARVLPKKNR